MDSMIAWKLKIIRMRTALISILCIFACCDTSVSQTNAAGYYRPVNIDSLLEAPILLPKNERFAIKKIVFSISTDQIEDIGMTGGATRDRLLQLKALDPHEDWEYKVGSAYVGLGGHTLELVLSKREQFYKLLDLSKSYQEEKKLRDIQELHVNKELIIKANMLTGKFERYDTSRDFLVQDIRIRDK